METNRTHHPQARSWVKSANSGTTDFPIQNLPFAVASTRNSPARRVHVAIGESAIDLNALAGQRVLAPAAQAAAETCQGDSLQQLFALGPAAWSALRAGLFDVLEESASRQVKSRLQDCLRPLGELVYSLPVTIGDYTDFYSSYHHALNAGRMSRPDNPVTPSFWWLPNAYHGRASTVVISGHGFSRPCGQFRVEGSGEPVFGPSRRLDFDSSWRPGSAWRTRSDLVSSWPMRTTIFSDARFSMTGLHGTSSSGECLRSVPSWGKASVRPSHRGW